MTIKEETYFGFTVRYNEDRCIAYNKSKTLEQTLDIPSGETYHRVVREWINSTNKELHKSFIGDTHRPKFSTIDFNSKFVKRILDYEFDMFSYQFIVADNEYPLLKILPYGQGKSFYARGLKQDGNVTTVSGSTLTDERVRSFNMVHHGRYMMERINEDLFELVLHSVCHDKQERVRLDCPGFTLATYVR